MNIMKVVFLGQAGGTSLPNGPSSGLITFSSDRIDSKYVSKNGAIFTLQPGVYISIVQVRWQDNLNCNLELYMSNSICDDGWKNQNYRLSSSSICLHYYGSETTTTPSTYIDNGTGGSIGKGQLIIIKLI